MPLLLLFSRSWRHLQTAMDINSLYAQGREYYRHLRTLCTNCQLNWRENRGVQKRGASCQQQATYQTYYVLTGRKETMKSSRHAPMYSRALMQSHPNTAAWAYSCSACTATTAVPSQCMLFRLCNFCRMQLPVRCSGCAQTARAV
jgi:hypothetical protein